MQKGKAGFKTSNYDYKGPFKLSAIAKIIGCEVNAKDGKIVINDLAPLDSAGQGDLSFFDNSKYLEQFKHTKASACIVNSHHAGQAPSGTVAIVVDEPYRAYAKIAQAFYYLRQDEIHKSAVIEATAKIGKNTSIGAHTYIGRNVQIGENCHIAHNVTIQAASIGNDCVMHPGVRIGQEGFGFALGKGEHLKVPQLGGVIIGNGVEIGANSCVDRGSGPDTIIGDGTKIDNQVQIAHNVEIGKFCIIVAQAGIAGSAKIGDYVVLGGKVGVNGHIKIGSGAKVAAHSGVMRDVEPGMTVGGQPAVEIRDWHRSMLAVEKLGKKNKS